MGNRFQVADWSAVESLMARARNRGQILSNFFADSERMSEWCADGRLSAEEGDGVTLLWRDQETFCNLYFFAESTEALSSALGDVGKPVCRRVVSDVVGPDMVRLPLVEVFRSAGFCQISELVRMSRRTPECTVSPTIFIESPKVDDIPDMQVIFREHFNPEVEQLPSDTELRRWIEKGGVLAHRDDRGKVHSFIIYDLNKASLYLRYWFVEPQVRDCGVGGQLMKTMFFNAQHTRRQYFWVITDNDNAIRRYEHYGFAPEPMLDTVLAKNF